MQTANCPFLLNGQATNRCHKYSSSLNFCPLLSKFGISRQIFIDLLNIKFHKNPSIWNSADTWEQTDRQADGRT